MSEFDLALRNAVKGVVGEMLGSLPIPSPELISVEEAATICGFNRSVIDSLIKERRVNGFPAVKFGERSIKIDKRRLHLWIEAGGLKDGESQ